MRVTIFFSGGLLDGDTMECPLNLVWPSEFKIVDEAGEPIEGRYILSGEGEESTLSEEPAKYVWQGGELLHA
jgi:hypothetical protein